MPIIGDYPDQCLRGIKSKTLIPEEGLVNNELFYFDEKNSNGFFELSINWNDPEKAIPFTLAQKKDDGVEIKYKGGIAVIDRSELDKINKLQLLNGMLSYERAKLPENLYHGNLLLNGDVSKLKRKYIAVTLAIHVSEIIPQME